MKRFHYHPDKMICIRNGDKIYYESLAFARFDIGLTIPPPVDNSDEYEYIIGYGTRNFNRTDMLSFSEMPRNELDNIIENIDVLISKQKTRGAIDENAWTIPEDML